MPAEAVIVIDAGTSALRAIEVRPGGDVTALASEPWRYVDDPDAGPYARQFDVAATVSALKSLLARANVARGTAAIAFTGQREGIAFVDAAGEALFASPNIDARAAAEGMAIDAAHGGQVYAATGHLPSLMQAPAKLQWLRTHRPAIAEQVRFALPLADWLASLLTGERAMSRTLAAENGLLDVSSGQPNPLLQSLGMDASLLPPVLVDGGVAGTASGFDVPIVLAGADTQCALLGTGAVLPGDTAAIAGWSAPLQSVTAAPIFDPQQRTWTSVHSLSDRWIVESNAGDTGRAWRWICDLLGVADDDAEALAVASPPGANDAVAVLGPSSMNAAAMNAGTGAIGFPLPLAVAAPNRGDILRSVLEATAFALRSNLEQIERVIGSEISALRLGGGASRSTLFRQVLADVISRPVHVTAAPETTGVGAAALALATVREQPFEDALASVAGPCTIVEPRLRISAEYDDYYARWFEECARREGG